MRTLTQVWVFLVSLTFLFLFISFELLGRAGLFFAFLASVLFFYAALRHNLSLFRGILSPELYTGNDPTGFLSEVENQKLKFGFKKIDVHTTEHTTPPLVWKNSEDHGHILLNKDLLNQLSKEEVRLLAIFLLSHLENRSFVAVHILSTIKIPLYFLSFFTKVLSSACHRVFKTAPDCFTSDLKFITMAESSKFEVGYFLNRLHRLSVNHLRKPNSYCFFSTLSIAENPIINEFGIPDLNSRLKKIMGFSL
jgi:hypothetical protein